jgi:hypothetical protein
MEEQTRPSERNGGCEILHYPHMATQLSNRDLNCDLTSAKPEWLRIPEAVRIFGIGRSTLYVLISEGKVKSRSLRRRGAIKGIRLISYDSLAAFIEGQPA